MSTDKPTSESRRTFAATSAVLGAAGMLWAALPSLVTPVDLSSLLKETT